VSNRHSHCLPVHREASPKKTASVRAQESKM
jgi:hypothetical protein